MRVNFPKLHQSTGNKKPRQPRDSTETRLWHIGVSVSVAFGAVLLGVVSLTWATWALLNYPKLPHPRTLSMHDTVGALQLVLASVAGAGALVGLLVAYRRQKVAEADSTHDRTRVFNERFTAIATQLGDDKPAVRLAGMHAMAGLADDWKANRQTCVDVLCAYLRIPYEPDPGEDASIEKRLAFDANREVRHTAIRVIAAHLRSNAPVSWQGLNLDFTGVVFDGGDFSGAVFSDSMMVSFQAAVFSAGWLKFDNAVFAGNIEFTQAKFSGGRVTFGKSEFSGGTVDFGLAVFSGGTVEFGGAKFSGGTLGFQASEFSGGKVWFGTGWNGGSVFSAGLADFRLAKFLSGEINFYRTMFTGGKITFREALFSGGEISFDEATFTGGEIDFNNVKGLSHPPDFPWADAPYRV